MSSWCLEGCSTWASLCDILKSTRAHPLTSIVPGYQLAFLLLPIRLVCTKRSDGWLIVQSLAQCQLEESSRRSQPKRLQILHRNSVSQSICLSLTSRMPWWARCVAPVPGLLLAHRGRLCESFHLLSKLTFGDIDADFLSRVWPWALLVKASHKEVSCCWTFNCLAYVQTSLNDPLHLVQGQGEYSVIDKTWTLTVLAFSF